MENHLIDITHFSHDCRGIGTVSGKKAFVRYSLPNEKVSFQYIKRLRRYNEGYVTEVLNPSPYRTQPRCEHFANCGGCQLQHATPEHQIELKHNILSEMLLHDNIHVASWAEPLKSEPWHYRYKARLSIKYVKVQQKLMIGFRSQQYAGSVTDMQHCDILPEFINNFLQEAKLLISESATYDQFPQIEIACSDQDHAVILRHLKPLPESDIKKWITLGEKHQIFIYLQPGNLDSVHCIMHTLPKMSYQHPAHQINIKFEPTDFTQVNFELNRAMVNQAIDWLKLSTQDHVLDLFCGLGNFTLPIARHVKQITGIELSESLLKRADMNAEANQITNARFIAHDLTKIDFCQSIKQHYDKIILDPPRSGAEKIIPHIMNLTPSYILYISCNPITFARDAKLLTNTNKYELAQIGIMDMFPHTKHVETMGLFKRKKT